MNLQVISSSLPISQLDHIQDAGSASPAAAALAAPQDKVSMSGPGQLYSKLQALQKDDPAELQKVLTQLAQNLQAQGQAQGGAQGAALEALSSKFKSAADTGDISQLRPGQGQVHGGGHKHHGGGGHAKQVASLLDNAAPTTDDPLAALTALSSTNDAAASIFSAKKS